MEFHNNNGIKVLFKYISNETVIDAYVKSYQKPKSIKFILLNSVIRSAIGVLLNLTKVIDSSNFKQQWKDCEAVRTFTNLLIIRFQLKLAYF